jgi:hypothetical protein
MGGNVVKRANIVWFGPLALGFMFGLSACVFDAFDSSSSSAKNNNSSQGQGGSSNGGGTAGSQTIHDPPTITSISPSFGSYGEVITITGTDLGSTQRGGVQIKLGQGSYLIPNQLKREEIVSWDENQIQLRYPFPVPAGEIVVETPEGQSTSKPFTPSWQASVEHSGVPLGGSLASVSPQAGTSWVIFGLTPPKLVKFELGIYQEYPVVPGDVAIPTIKLFKNATGSVEGIGINQAGNELIYLQSDSKQGLTGVPTGITFDDGDFALAGGGDGGVAWLHRTDGWVRARQESGTWTIDKGPVEDPYSTHAHHAVGTTTDGSLYIVWSEKTGNFLDDTGTPYYAQLKPNDSGFGTKKKGGAAVDDYVTSIEVHSRGNGFLIHYCGSDVDPFHLSSSDMACFTAGHTEGGGHYYSVPRKELPHDMHAFTFGSIAVSYCDKDAYLRVSTLAGTDPGTAILWPCTNTNVVALDIDPMGNVLPVVSLSNTLYAMQKQPKPDTP